MVFQSNQISNCSSNEVEATEKGSYNAHFTSSSDEECDSSLKSKIHAKKMILAKATTNSSVAKSNIDEEEEQHGEDEEDDDHHKDKMDGNKIDDPIEDAVDKTLEVMDVDCKSEDGAKKLSTQKKKRRKQNKRNVNLPTEVDIDKTLMKYWVKRYRLFSKFDEGIKLDRGT